ncbi:MAG: rRNA maturation RNase YbeY [Clostridia bacterium]|nr:rRNA maturation RNase YbeY [Clostridia bacterium]
MVRLIWDNEQSVFEVTEELIDILKSCMEKALEYEGFTYDTEISLTFTDNVGIRQVNNEVRGIDKATDVLSFPMLEPDENGKLEVFDEDLADGAVLLGDILISAQKAISQAEEFGHSFKREICFLTVHSMLHLLGYDHELGEKEEAEMFLKQEEILSLLGITR